MNGDTAVVAIRSQAHRLYALEFIILVLSWPFWVFHVPWLLWSVVALNTLLYILIVRYTGSRQQSFWRGLCALAASFEVGCINVTFLYIPFILLYYYILMIIATYVGIRENKEWTEAWWINTVSGRFSSEEEYEALLGSPKWFS